MFRYAGHEVYVVTTRFSERTWRQNKEWREKRGKLGCLYGQPRTTMSAVPEGAVMIVVEMNNDVGKLGRVEGLGLCYNRPLDAVLRVYGQRQYDRVVYAGKYRVDRQYLDAQLLDKLEQLCFTGQCHLKRGIGFTSMPSTWISKELATGLRRAFYGCDKRRALIEYRVVHIEAPC